MNFTAVYYEPGTMDYTLGKELRQKYVQIPWFEIKSHNRIDEMTQKSNKEFIQMKRYLIVGTRKTHRYTQNQKISDFLVPFTSSGCSAMCLYCYLVCNYNKCSYLRLFVNREIMLKKLIDVSNKSETLLTFEIGSNSDLILENTITNNLLTVIPEFGQYGRGKITFPTKFSAVEPLLSLDHQGKTVFRMSVNPQEIITNIELGTSSLKSRLLALNKMSESGYPVGILIAPVILIEGCKKIYEELIDTMEALLTNQVKKNLSIEIIFMTYSFIHRAINQDAFPDAPNLYDKTDMSVRGHGKYAYRLEKREPMEQFLSKQIKIKFPEANILYIC